MQGVNVKKTTIAMAVGSMACLANGAWAAESNSLEIAPITVSGEKINRTLEQTQSSVVVVTEQQLRDKADHSLVDVFARISAANTQPIKSGDR